MQSTCPKCQTHLNYDDDLAGKLARCPGCGNRIILPGGARAASSGGKAGPAAARTASPSGGENDAANISLWLSLLIGAGITGACVLLLLPFRSTFFGAVFFTGGWVNWVELLLFSWGLAILILKLAKSRRQLDALLLDILPAEISPQITPQNVDLFLDRLHKLPARMRDSLMVNRIRKALELFKARSDNSEVVTLLGTLSGVDANRIAGSYSLVKVFLWAIPILGFIGTVLGLSLAMAGFGQADLTNVEELKGSVGTITGGLATAFNTTLFGLILSMFLMFPMSAIQKREEDILTDIEAFCTEVLLPRLDDGGKINTDDPAAWLEILARKTTEQQAAFLERLDGTLHALKTMIDRADESVAERVARSVETSQAAATRHLGALEEGVGSLNRLLEKLGEKQVVIQMQVKKRWFGR